MAMAAYLVPRAASSPQTLANSPLPLPRAATLLQKLPNNNGERRIGGQWFRPPLPPARGGSAPPHGGVPGTAGLPRSLRLAPQRGLNPGPAAAARSRRDGRGARHVQ